MFSLALTIIYHFASLNFQLVVIHSHEVRFFRAVTQVDLIEYLIHILV